VELVGETLDVCEAEGAAPRQRGAELATMRPVIGEGAEQLLLADQPAGEQILAESRGFQRHADVCRGHWHRIWASPKERGCPTFPHVAQVSSVTFSQRLSQDVTPGRPTFLVGMGNPSIFLAPVDWTQGYS
jgi:hypothetical protein